MKDSDTLHIEVQSAIALLKQESRLFVGPVIPRYLPAAMPPFGNRRSRMDEIALLVMCEILSAHRPNKSGHVFWKGGLYQVNLVALAQQYGCRYKDVSRALSFLERKGLLRLAHRGRKNLGLWGGSRVFAVPCVDRIASLITEAKVKTEIDRGSSGDAIRDDTTEMTLTDESFESDERPWMDIWTIYNEQTDRPSEESESTLNAKPTNVQASLSLKSDQDSEDGAGGADRHHTSPSTSHSEVVGTGGTVSGGVAPTQVGLIPSIPPGPSAGVSAPDSPSPTPSSPYQPPAPANSTPSPPISRTGEPMSLAAEHLPIATEMPLRPDPRTSPATPETSVGISSAPPHPSEATSQSCQGAPSSNPFPSMAVGQIYERVPLATGMPVRPAPPTSPAISNTSASIPSPHSSATASQGCQSLPPSSPQRIAEHVPLATGMPAKPPPPIANPAVARDSNSAELHIPQPGATSKMPEPPPKPGSNTAAPGKGMPSSRVSRVRLPWDDPKLPEAERQLIIRSYRFQQTFEEAYIRYHRNAPNPGRQIDLSLIQDFMRKNPQSEAWNLAATAIIAWNLADKHEIPFQFDATYEPGPGDSDETSAESDHDWEVEEVDHLDHRPKFDPVFFCRRAGTMRSFLHNVGAINGEIKTQGLHRQTYAVLRSLFTHSELEKFGWTNYNALGLLDPESSQSLFGFWEYNPFFKVFYPLRGQPFPPGTPENLTH